MNRRMLVAGLLLGAVVLAFAGRPGLEAKQARPVVLMNLFLSLQAAYTAPVLMMSQNRLAARDRLEAHNDYEINRKAEEEVRAVLNHLSAQDRALTRIVEALASRLHALPPAGDPPGNTSPV